MRDKMTIKCFVITSTVRSPFFTEHLEQFACWQTFSSLSDKQDGLHLSLEVMLGSDCVCLVFMGSYWSTSCYVFYCIV